MIPRWIAALAMSSALFALPACADKKESAVPTPTSKSTTTMAMVMADDIPIAHTPPGGYGDRFPEPILTTCTEPLVAGAPDLRGTWKTAAAEKGGAPVPADSKIYRHVQRIEQCGNRLIVTGGGVIHDMRVDGTAENGVHDVLESDYTTPMVVVATYENGVHILRPVGLPVEVTRHLEGDKLIWNYLGTKVTLARV